jgi:hypothetical protein
MTRLVAVAFLFVLSVLAVAGSAGSAGPPVAAASAPTFMLASQLRPPRGGASPAAHGYLPLDVRRLALAKAAANARAGVGGGRPKPKPGGGAPIVYAPANVASSFDGTYQTQLTPPDPTGAIGPDRFVETVNTKYAIYTRAGALLDGGSLSSLTGLSGGLFGYNLSDPQVMWDSATGRFYYSVLYFDSFFFSTGLAVGWSKTSTPASAADFCQYAIEFGGELPDYPKLGDSGDFLLVGYNAFGSFASTYDGSSFIAVNKPAPGADCAPPSAFKVYTSGVLANADGNRASTPVPAVLVDDSTGAGYVVANADLTDADSYPDGASFVSVYGVTTSGTDADGLPVPALTGPTSVPVPSYQLPANAPQQGSTFLLDTLDGRFEAAVAAVDPAHEGRVAVWTAHAVFGGPGAEERWYEIDPAGTLLQSGAASSTSLFVWNGAVSPDRAGSGSTGSFGDSMAMSVSTSSASSFPALQLVWKKGANPQSPLTRLVQATGPSVDFSCSDTTPCRWGDYSGARPDPSATGTAGLVWLANQYNVASSTASDTDWRTRVFAVRPS